LLRRAWSGFGEIAGVEVSVDGMRQLERSATRCAPLEVGLVFVAMAVGT
jgi:hypothetical protein